MFGREIPKQRGIYSEILTTEDTENIKVNINYLHLLSIVLFYFMLLTILLQTVSTFGPNRKSVCKVNVRQSLPRAVSISQLCKKRSQLRTAQNPRPTTTKMFVGKDYFRNPEVNEGHYSKKRLGVADVDPKVSSFYD